MAAKKSVRRKAARGVERQGKAKDIVVKVRVDPARKKIYDAMRAQMHASRAEEAAGFDDYWEAVDRILEGELWSAGGYETEEDFCREVLKAKVRTAKRMAKVARFATEKEIETYAPTLLDEVVAVFEAKAGGPLDGKMPVRFDRVRVPKVVDGETKMVGLDVATVEDVRAYKRTLLRQKGKARTAASPAAQQLIEVVTKIASLAGVTVTVSNGKARFGEVPLAALNVLGRALASVTLTSPGAAPAKRIPKKPRKK